MPERATERKTYEAHFWDERVRDGRTFRRFVYTRPLSAYLEREIQEALGTLEGKRVLFVGCGTSSGTAKAMARRGASVWCLDISPESVRKLNGGLEECADRVRCVVGDAENLPFEDGFFDVVLGKAIVHHLDVARFMAEVSRVARPGCRIVFSEPLGMNPLVNLFRRMTPRARVPTEHPLLPDDLKLIGRHCARLERRYSFLLSMAAIPLFFLYMPTFGHLAFRAGCAFDRLLFTVLPPVRWLAWHVLLVGTVATPDTAPARAGG